MIISFNFGLYPQDEMRRLATHLVPIMDGLAENGHRVERFAVGLKPPPVVNILVHHRGVAAAAVGEVIELKRQRPATKVGILCLGPVNDDGEPATPSSGPDLARLAAAADFVWSVLPPDEVPGLADMAGKLARIHYGFSARSLGVNVRPEALVPRDIDVAFRGIATPRRQAVWEALVPRGVTGFWLDNANFPPYLADDLLGRSKIVLDFNPETAARGRSPALTVQALHNGAVVVSEGGATGWHTAFDGFSVVAPYEALADRCLQVLGSGFHAQLGLAALQKFRAETSMRDSMAAALGLLA